MKKTSTQIFGAGSRLLVGMLCGILTSSASALTDIANIPLANASPRAVLPNIYLVLDNSGSMSWSTVPGATGEFQFIPRLRDFWTSSQCNGLGYDPAQTYFPPASQGTTTYTDQLYTAALNDGFRPTQGNSDLRGSVYFVYSGAERELNFQYNAAGNAVLANNFYNECNTAAARISIGGATPNKSCSVTSVTVNGVELLSGATATSTSKTTVAARIAANVTATGYAAVAEDVNVYIYSGSAADASRALTVTRSCTGGGNNMTFGTTAFPSLAAGPGLGRFTPVRVDTLPAADQTNYANWYSYYRTRINMAKSSIGQAFADVRGTPVSFFVDPTDGDFIHARIGMNQINNPASLAVANFDTTQKQAFYDQLYTRIASGSTPLRGALKNAGDMYANAAGSPVQYYCQRNYVILTTDGYWNDGAPAGIGNQDGGATPRPQFEGPNASTASLADIAMFYYRNDLRTGGDWDKLLYTTDEADPNWDLQVDDVANWQHVTTYTIGMGVDGTLRYDGPEYKTSTDTTNPYVQIRNGTLNWPVPASNSPTGVDDLWHAAVNGRGTYFNAKNPRALQASLRQALNSINRAPGTASPNATGSLNPSPGGDKAYGAGYSTGEWVGDLIAYQIDNDGSVSSTVEWKAADQLKTRISADGRSDTRVIKTGSTSLVDFLGSNIPAGDLAKFATTQLNQSQDTWTAAQQTTATVDTLVEYLRGQTEYDIGGGVTARLYRARSSPLGDIVHSQPVYVGKSTFSFNDAGHESFKAGTESRPGTVYVGANDGMLHAFDATSGQERWAYVPPMVYRNLWRLADRDYRVNHRYFVDGPLAFMDAEIGGAWRTVMIGALGAGGRGYYALDVTVPDSPALLWTFSADDNPNVGYTFGTPLMLKLDGEWVAVLTSGYNNIPEGGQYTTANGEGYVFVLRLADGTVLRTINTGVGSAALPSGLAALNAEVRSVNDYTALRAYGGDLEGNMWRFDLSAGTASKLMALGNRQPITSAPEIARPNGKSTEPLVYFGTGRYLGRSDLENIDGQSFYAVRDDGSTTVAASSLAKHTLSASGQLVAGGSSSSWGWMVDLPSAGERVHIHPQIQLGVLMFVTTIPPSVSPIPGDQDAACKQAAGTGWLYQLDFKDGLSVDGDPQVGTFFDSPPVGITPIGTSNLPGYTKDKASGRVQVKTVTGGGTVDIKQKPFAGNAGNATRVQWRELLN